jgi:predicted nucleotidyltransferase
MKSGLCTSMITAVEKLTKTKTILKNCRKYHELKIGLHFFAEGLSEHLYIGKIRQFHKLLQSKLSANSLKKIFIVLPTLHAYTNTYIYKRKKP